MFQYAIAAKMAVKSLENFKILNFLHIQGA
jgi:hypothetical protein